MDSSFQKQLNEMFRGFKTLPYLFVGSGFSRRYLGLDTWESLLRRYVSMLSTDPMAYRVYEENAEELNSEYGIKPGIASLLERDFKKRWLNDLEFRSQHTGYEAKVDAGVSIFKCDIAQYFQCAVSGNNYSLKYPEEIQLLRNVSVKNVAGIITTNYDCLLESIFKNFQIFTGQNEILTGRTTGMAEIYKIHGCCTTPSSIVITDSDYQEFVENCDYLVAKLLTFFLESPIVFLGYRIDDWNIRKILARATKCIPLEMQEEIRKRMIFVQRVHPENGETEGIYEFRQDWLDEDKKDCMPMTCVRVNSFGAIYEALANVHSKYSPKILQQLKHDIYELVLTQAPTAQMRVVGLENCGQDERIEAVVGVGVLRDFGTKGYTRIESNELYEDIVLDNLQSKWSISAEGIVRHALPRLIKDPMPLFKYISAVNPDEIPEEVKDKIPCQFDNLFSATDKKNRNCLALPVRSVKGIVQNAKNIACELHKINSLTEDEISLEELEHFLRDIFQHPETVWQRFEKSHSSQLKRIIRIYDWSKYRHAYFDK